MITLWCNFFTRDWALSSSSEIYLDVVLLHFLNCLSTLLLLMFSLLVSFLSCPKKPVQHSCKPIQIRVSIFFPSALHAVLLRLIPTHWREYKWRTVSSTLWIGTYLTCPAIIPHPLHSFPKKNTQKTAPSVSWAALIILVAWLIPLITHVIKTMYWHVLSIQHVVVTQPTDWTITALISVVNVAQPCDQLQLRNGAMTQNTYSQHNPTQQLIVSLCLQALCLQSMKYVIC